MMDAPTAEASASTLRVIVYLFGSLLIVIALLATGESAGFAP